MVRRVMRRQLTFALAILLSGCLWRGSGEILSVHLDVLTQTAAKLCAVVEAGRGPNAQELAEYVYPSQRGREFLRQFGGYAERPSYRHFAAFLERYEAMVHTADTARAEQRLSTELPRLISERDALQKLATDIRAEIKAGT